MEFVDNLIFIGVVSFVLYMLNLKLRCGRDKGPSSPVSPYLDQEPPKEEAYIPPETRSIEDLLQELETESKPPPQTEYFDMDARKATNLMRDTPERLYKLEPIIPPEQKGKLPDAEEDEAERQERLAKRFRQYKLKAQKGRQKNDTKGGYTDLRDPMRLREAFVFSEIFKRKFD
jgi:hypothetical protein